MENFLNKTITIEDVFSLFAEKNNEVKSMELTALLKLYSKYQQTKVRPDTIRAYNDHIPTMIKFFNSMGIYESKQFNQDVIDRFVKFSIASQNKAITINKRIGMLTAMFKRMSEAGVITMPNYKYQKLKEQEAKVEVIKKDDVVKILNQIDSMKLSHQIIIYLLIATGIRRNELVNIKSHNINFNNLSIYLEFTKTGKPRYCYFNEHIKDLLMKLTLKNDPNNPYLFQHQDTHIDKQTVSSMLYKLKRDLGIDVLSSHKFRHLYATSLLKNGADIFTVKQLLGHSRLEVTQRYLDFTNEEIKQNNFKYNPLNNFK